jgi:hypothetical protein
VVTYPIPESLANLVSNLIATRKLMKAPLDAREGIITDFRIPSKIRIDELHEVSAVYKGSVKSGYFSLLIIDRDGIKQWFEDSNSVGYKTLDSGESVRTGNLNFSNGLYESKWKFTPGRPLYTGYAKAIVHMFEDTNVYPLTFQEKDIHLI